jgi:hypothetical protein
MASLRSAPGGSVPFARLGYSATNVEDIAKEAGMAKATNLYFKSLFQIQGEGIRCVVVQISASGLATQYVDPAK